MKKVIIILLLILILFSGFVSSIATPVQALPILSWLYMQKNRME
ncbi:hypothetical protein [Geomicrobium sp. JCM 19039]|nr:hypothetical protein [Geomicrobium sp. JCM 19039]